MKRVISVEEMRLMEEKTYESKNIESFDLMFQAGNKLFMHLKKEGTFDKKRKTLIVSGLGNNGGDALVIAAKLEENLYPVQSVIVGDLKYQSPENKQIEQSIKSKNYVSIHDDLVELDVLLKDSDLVIDGLFGIGLNKPIKGLYADVIDLINKSDKEVISIDVPSGLEGNTGLVKGIAIKASKTLSVQNIKFGNVINDAKDFNGKIAVVDVGIDPISKDMKTKLIDDSILRIKKRQKNSHKYNYGNILTIGGSNGMMGAPILSAHACLRTGSGLSHLYYNKKYQSLIQMNIPDIMLGVYENVSEIVQVLKKKNVIIFGPGLGREDSINYTILRNILETDIKIVIDADGLYYYKTMMDEFKERGNIIITPHIKEFSILLDSSIDFIKENTTLICEEFASKYNVLVVLKSHSTLITDGIKTYINNDSTPALATAGTGDVLSGIIASFVGQGYPMINATTLGVYVHAQAGKYAEKEFGENSVLATDVINHIHQVLLQSTNR